MPRTHTITETGAVADALDRLRAAGGDECVVIDELVILGAEEKLRREASRPASDDDALARLVAMVRERRVPMDPETADHVRRYGWVRPT